MVISANHLRAGLPSAAQNLPSDLNSLPNMLVSLYLKVWPIAAFKSFLLL